MPRGNPKLPILIRFDRELVEAVKAYDVQFTEAVEDGLRLWLAREQRRARAAGFGRKGTGMANAKSAPRRSPGYPARK